jgi:hypothetical protein
MIKMLASAAIDTIGYISCDDYKRLVTYMIEKENYSIFPLHRVFDAIDRKKKGYISLEDVQNVSYLVDML